MEVGRVGWRPEEYVFLYNRALALTINSETKRNKRKHAEGKNQATAHSIARFPNLCKTTGAVSPDSGTWVFLALAPSHDPTGLTELGPHSCRSQRSEMFTARSQPDIRSSPVMQAARLSPSERLACFPEMSIP